MFLTIKLYLHLNYVPIPVPVSAFTLVGLNQPPPKQVQHLEPSRTMLLIEDDLNLIEGRVPSPTRKNTLFAEDFP